MTDKEIAIKNIMKFLKDETKRILLVRGYDNDAKLRAVLYCLNKLFDSGIIRTSSMAEISFHINRAFKTDILPRSVKSTISYKLGRMTVRIASYATNTKFDNKGNDRTFTLYHPVENVLKDSKRYQKFLNDIVNMNSSKIILITTNEWGIKDWDIENKVDEIFFYGVENDNPKLMQNLRNNGAI
ncbi:hypothetical protein MOE92_20085 [Bacillus spizizenii]|nr:hypothetical protein [Bacillus spizizenii]